MIYICKACDAKALGKGNGSTYVLCLDCGGDFCFACLHDDCRGRCGCETCELEYDDEPHCGWTMPDEFLEERREMEEAATWMAGGDDATA